MRRTTGAIASTARCGVAATGRSWMVLGVWLATVCGVRRGGRIIYRAMPRRKIIANLTSLVASVTIAWSVHGLMAIGSCGGDGKPECPPGIAPYVIGIFVAAILAIGSAIAGGHAAIPGIFLGIGAGAIWAGFDAPGGERSDAFVMGGIFLGVALLPLIALPVLMVMKRGAVRLVTDGAPAIATVLEVQDTGTTINKNPRVRMKLRITPQDGV